MNHTLELTIELYKRRNFETLGLFDKQLEALERLVDDQTNEVMYGGAARGGKSWLGCLWKILNRLSMSESIGLIAREESTKLKDTSQKTFFKVLDFLELREGEDYVFLAGKQKVDFYNGSEELFRDLKYKPADDPEFDRIGSYDLTDAFIDESQQIHYKAISVLKGRYSELKGKNKITKNGIVTFEDWRTIPKAFYSCNPSKNWIYTDFYQPYTKGELPNTKVFIPSLPSDNPHVDQSYIDNLKTSDKITKERLLYGNFDYDDDPDSLCDWKAICDIFNNDHVEPDESDRRLISDLAMKGRDDFIIGYLRGMVLTFPLIKNKATGKSIEEDLRKQKKEKNVPNRRIIADSDGLGSYLSSYIENIVEFHNGGSPNDSKFGSLKDECAYKLAEVINASEFRIIAEKEIEEEVKRELSICLKSSSNVDDKKIRIIKKSAMKEKLGRSPDYFDILIMSMLPLVEHTFHPIG